MEEKPGGRGGWSKSLQAYRPRGIPLMDFQIREETRTVKTYSWDCERCGRRLVHIHRRTLQHNIEEHVAQRHGEKAEQAIEMRDVLKEIGRIRRHLNRRYGV